MVVCQRPRETQDAQCIIYRKQKVPNFNLLYLGNYSTVFIKFTYFMLYLYMTLHIKFERNQISGEQDIIHFQKLSNFLHIFLLLRATF